MSSLLDFATMIAAHPFLRWDLWPTYGVLGVVLASVAGLAGEFRHLFSARAVDLSRRSAGALSWERSRVRRELDGGHTLSLAPEAEQRAGAGWRLEARSRRCPEQNGDFFDTVELDDDHLAFFLGDVSGRGLPAALYQTSCKALLRYATFTPGKTAAAVEEVNSVLCQRDPDGRFATLLYGVLEISTGRVALVSAGHEGPLLQRADGTTRTLVMPPRLPLGMSKTPEYKAVQVTLEKGDRLLLSTDGVTQARDRGRRPFSQERLCTVGYRHRQADLENWADQIISAVDRFGFRCVDDRTVLALSYEGKTEEVQE